MAGSVNPQNPNTVALLQALFQVSVVAQGLQALLPQAQANGAVSVPATQLQRWQNNLQRALDFLGQIAVILIFPPPPIARFTEEARTQINVALGVLQAVPTTRIFPPSLSQGSLSLQALQTALSALQQAEVALVRAIQSA